MKLVKFVVGLSMYLIALAIHEYGHLRELQKRNVEIEEFSLGIGPVWFQYRTDSAYKVSFRLIPIMAYVKPTDSAIKSFEKASVEDKITVAFAGVRNNFFAGLVPIFFLQLLGWKKGNISLKEWGKAVVTTPCKVLLRFVAFLVGCATLGRINFAGKLLLSTGGINPPTFLRWFILLNLIIGYINLSPIPAPLDGSKVLEAVLAPMGSMPRIPDFFTHLFFAICFWLINSQDMRMLQIQEIE